MKCEPRGHAKTALGRGSLKFLSSLPITWLAVPHSPEMRLTNRAPLAADRRTGERVLTSMPIRIVSVGDSPTCYPGICRNLSRGGVGFETEARLQVGQVVVFEFVNLTDEAVRYSIQILSRNDQRYGGRYVDSEDDDR